MQDITIRIDSRWLERFFWIMLVLILGGLLAWKWIQLETLDMSDIERLEKEVGFDLDEIEKAEKAKEDVKVDEEKKLVEDIEEEADEIDEEEPEETQEEIDTREQKELEELSGEFEVDITNTKFVKKGDNWGKITEVVVNLANGLDDDYNLKFDVYVYDNVDEKEDNMDTLTFEKLFQKGYSGLQVLRPNEGLGISVNEINKTKVVEVKVYDALTEKILGLDKKSYDFT